MLALLIALLSVYLAIRLTLSEFSRRIGSFRKLWKRLLRLEESSSKVESSLMTPRRKTGIVNGKIPFQKPPRRRFNKYELDLPFLDSGAWFQGGTKRCISGLHYIETAKGQTKGAIPELTDESNIVNMLKVPTQNSNSWFITRLYEQLLFFIGRNPPATFPDVSDKVVSSERVKEAIRTTVIELLKGKNADSLSLFTEHATQKTRARRVLNKMKSHISGLLLRFAALVMYKILGRMLDGIEVNRQQLENVKRVAQENVPIIYLPLHRSHLDYILVTFILYMNDIRAPLVAAGNNLMIPFFGQLLRGLGAFFIKRKLDTRNGQRDHVYRAILHSYMEESLKAGNSLEFFIEGGRSRTGKALLPKAGLLSMVVDTLNSDMIKDAYIVPIAMSYEKVLDGNFVSEQLGMPKIAESFTSAFRAIWSTWHSNFGGVKVDFCQPFSLKEFLETAKYAYSSQSDVKSIDNLRTRKQSEYGPEIVVSEDQRRVIKDLSEYVVYGAFNAYSLMSTNLLAFLLLTKHRKGVSYEQLIASLDWLRKEVQSREKTIAFTGESAELIKRSTRLLGDNLVTVEKVKMEWSSDQQDRQMHYQFYKPSVKAPEVLELQYYANSVIPVFLVESIVVNAYCSLIPVTQEEVYSTTEIHISFNDILKTSLDLCKFFQYEFIFSPPGTGIEAKLIDTINDLLDKSFFDFHCANNESLDWKLSKSSNTDTLELDEDDFALKLNTTDENMNMFYFLKGVLKPYFQAYFIAASCVEQLYDEEMEGKQYGF